MSVIAGVVDIPTPLLTSSTKILPTWADISETSFTAVDIITTSAIPCLLITDIVTADDRDSVCSQ